MIEEKVWSKIKEKLPLEVKWISWDNNGFGTLKEIKEKDNELQFIVENSSVTAEDMIFRGDPTYVNFNKYIKTFRTFSWTIRILEEEKSQ